MSYYTDTERELAQAGIQEGELAIYTGTVNPLQFDTLDISSRSFSAYVFFWKNGTAKQLRGPYFRPDINGLCTLEAALDGNRYAFLRDRKTGYIRQTAGPAKPVVLGNLGAIPLKADTLLGRFEVPAGTLLRLDENAPKRKRHKVLLRFAPSKKQPLQSAALWDGKNWRQLNICKESSASDDDVDADVNVIVRDGHTVVQLLTVRSNMIHMAASPEPNPDYEIYVAGDEVNTVTFEFDRREYRDGLPMPVRRTLDLLADINIFDIVKVQQASASKELRQCAVELADLTAESPGPKGILENNLRSGTGLDRFSDETVPHARLSALAKWYQSGTALPQAILPEIFPE